MSAPTGTVARWSNRVRNRVEPLALRQRLGIDRSVTVEHLGSDYGGYLVPQGALDKGSVVLSAGIGEDTSFDEAVIERYGCRVVGVDPTPRAIAHATVLADHEPRFEFQSVGLWSSDTVLEFFPPADAAHVSHSVVNLQGTADPIRLEVRTLDTVLADAGLADDGPPAVDLLKLDIEGAEHEVLASVLASGMRPKTICFEIDQPCPIGKAWATLREVRAAGYRLVANAGWTFTFLRQDP